MCQKMRVRMSGRLEGNFEVEKHTQRILHAMEAKGVSRAKSVDVGINKDSGLRLSAEFESALWCAVKLKKTLSRLGWTVTITSAGAL
jgi:hypothetical protein